MELTPELHRRLQIGGILLGLVLGATMSWTGFLASVVILRAVPIDAASFGLRNDVVVLVTFSNMAGAAFGGYLIARLWDHPALGILLGGAITALVSVFTGYVQTVSALEGNAYAEIIIMQLPIGLVFGAWTWFLGGLIGSVVMRLALGGSARLFTTGQPAPAWGLLVATGLGLGYIAGGPSPERSQAILAARAVDAAIHHSAGNSLPVEDLPPRYRVSGPAKDALSGVGPHLQSPYTLALVRDVVPSHESTIDARFEGGPVLRCVSTEARISRCFESGGR